MTMRDAISKLEAATEPSRVLDRTINEVLIDLGLVKTSPLMADLPHYTASIDTALTLVPSDYDFELKILGTADEGTWTCASIRWWKERRAIDEPGWQHRSGNSKHAAIALCAAALKVRDAHGEKARLDGE
jgi:hypothetical protein